MLANLALKYSVHSVRVLGAVGLVKTFLGDQTIPSRMRKIN